MRIRILKNIGGVLLGAVLISIYQPVYSQNQQQSKQSAQQVNRYSDGEFVRRVTEENQAVIELSKLASQKASSSRIKSYAQLMVEEHSKAKSEMSNILEKSRIMTNAGSYPDKNKDNVGMGKGTEADTSMGRGTELDKDEGVEVGANTGTGIDDPTGSASDSRINSTVKPGVPTGTDMETGLGTGEIPTSSTVMENATGATANLSAEHKTQYDKLAKLAGNEFDRQYIELMTKEHDKIIKLHEQQAKNGRNDLLRQYAIDAQPMAREHKEQAMQMKMGSQTNKKASPQKKSNQ